MDKINYIYGLYSTQYLNISKNKLPIKYIGRTDNPKTRLQSHIRDGIRGKNSPLCIWIKLVLDKGYEIKMTLLHQCDIFEVNKQEKIFIEEYKTNNLLNISNNERRSSTELYKRNKQLSGDNHRLNEQINQLMGGKDIKKEYKLLNSEINDLKAQVNKWMIYSNKLEQYISDNGLKPFKRKRKGTTS